MKRRMDLLFGILIICFLVLWYLGSENIKGIYKDGFILICGIGIISTLYILNRFVIFKKKISLSLQHILDNNFRTGISMSGSDEISFIADKFNKVINRINEFDLLREHKIDTLNRIITTINRNILDGVMILDMVSARIKINKAAQEIFNISQDDLSIDSVIKLEANSEFNKLYQDIINRRANTIAADLELFLPVLRAKAAISLKMFAIKDKDEQVNSILCIFNKS
ncbi:MAG: hypothetical protein ABIG64_09750 [Candidatus Omnitrophota bacterium]